MSQIAPFDYARRRLWVTECCGSRAPGSAQDASLTNFEYTQFISAYRALYLASDEWAGQADSLPPAAAVAEGQCCGFCDPACLRRSP